MNAHNEEWLGSTTTNLHGRAVRNFAPSSGCEQMITEPTHIDIGVLDLVLTDVPDVVGVRVGSPDGTSGYSALFIDVVLEQPIPHLIRRQKVYLKISVYWDWLEEV